MADHVGQRDPDSGYGRRTLASNRQPVQFTHVTGVSLRRLSRLVYRRPYWRHLRLWSNFDSGSTKMAIFHASCIDRHHTLQDASTVKASTLLTYGFEGLPMATAS